MTGDNYWGSTEIKWTKNENLQNKGNDANDWGSV